MYAAQNVLNSDLNIVWKWWATAPRLPTPVELETFPMPTKESTCLDDTSAAFQSKKPDQIKSDKGEASLSRRG